MAHDTITRQLFHQIVVPLRGDLNVKTTEREQLNQVRRAPTESQEINLQEDVQEAVRRRAYEIFEQRGMEPGSELEDWLQAEAEVLDAWASRRAA
jgi:hypothetical protein